MRKIVALILPILLFFLSSGLNSAMPPVVTPDQLSMDGAFIPLVDRTINDLIAKKNTPGAIVAIGRGDRICFLKAYGKRQEYPQPEPMTLDTLFDLASVTKVAATALSIHILIDRGQIKLDDPVCKYLPEFIGNGKEKITIRHCLSHTSGLDQAYKYFGTTSAIWKSMCQVKTLTPPGEIFRYSCPGYIVLGKLIERVSGQSLLDFTNKNIYEPLGMTDTMYKPGPDRCRRTAATLVDNPPGSFKFEKPKPGRKCLKGVPSDFRSRGLGGISGNAGLFSTVGDLATLASVLLKQGKYRTPDGKEARLFRPETFINMTESIPVTAGTRSPGWDKRSDKPNRAFLMSPMAIGHGGWSGTSFWIDPKFDLFVIVLTTRLHLDPQMPNIYPTAGYIGSLAIESIRDSRDDQRLRAKIEKSICRLDTLPGRKSNSALSQLLPTLKEKRIAFIFDSESKRIEAEKTGALTVQKFQYESGNLYTFRKAELSKDPANTTTSKLGSNRVKLAENRILPPDLRSVEAIVFDLDISGKNLDPALAVLGRAMQTAVDLRLPFYLIDRNNPTGLSRIEGPLPAPGTEAKIGFTRLPEFFGMTSGELALLLNLEFRMDLDLHIVPLPDRTLKFTKNDDSVPKSCSELDFFRYVRTRYLIYDRTISTTIIGGNSLTVSNVLRFCD